MEHFPTIPGVSSTLQYSLSALYTKDKADKRADSILKLLASSVSGVRAQAPPDQGSAVSGSRHGGLGLATTGLTCCCHQSLAPPRVLQQFAREQKLAPGSCLLERSATPLSYFGKLLSYFESRRFTSDTGAIGSATSEGDRTKCVPGRPFARPPSASAGETEGCRNLLALRRGTKATMVRNASVSAP